MLVGTRRGVSFRGRVLSVAAGALLADVATKIAGVTLLGRSSLGLGWVRLHAVRNSGLAFGVGASLSGGMILTVTVIVVAVLIAAVWRGGLREPLAAGLILGGAIANVLDRAVDGKVVDLIDVGSWPTFNLADALIIIGLGLLVMRGAREESPIRRPGSGSPGPSS